MTQFIGFVNVQICFPEGKQPSCKMCDLCRREDGLRYRCMITYEILDDMQTIGRRCPMNFEKKGDEDNG